MGSIAIAADKTVCVCRFMQVTHRPWLDDLGLCLTAHALRVFLLTQDAPLPKAEHPLPPCDLRPDLRPCILVLVAFAGTTAQLNAWHVLLHQ